MRKAPGLKRECGRVDLKGHPKPQPPPRLYAASGLQMPLTGNRWEGGRLLRPASQETGPAW